MKTILQQDNLDVFFSDGGAGERSIVNACDGLPENGVTEESRTAEAIGRLVRKLASPDLRTTGRRFVMLSLMLDGHALGSPSLAKASKQLGCTRAALSKINLQLQRDLNLRWRPSKSVRARQSYRQAQLRSVAKGTHSSLMRKTSLMAKRKKTL